MKLSQKEEQLMSLIWEKKKAYMKELLEAYPNPKPAPTTLATLLKRLAEKGAIDFELHGNSREYYSLINQNEYSSSYLNNMISTFFRGSKTRFASFFAKKSNMTPEELKELRDIIDQQIKVAEK